MHNQKKINTKIFFYIMGRYDKESKICARSHIKIMLKPFDVKFTYETTFRVRKNS